MSQFEFSPLWNKFGFAPEAPAGEDYSWIEIQDDIDIIGIDSSIIGAKLFYSSRLLGYFLFECENSSLFWDTTDISFAIFSEIGPIIEFSNLFGNRGQLSGVSPRMIQVLEQIGKLQTDSMIPPSIIIEQTMQTSVVAKSTHIDAPKIPNGAGQIPFETVVTVTGAALPAPINGIVVITSDAIVVQQEKQTVWSLPLSTIVSVSGTSLTSYFITILLKDCTRFEIAFMHDQISVAKQILGSIQEFLKIPHEEEFNIASDAEIN